jgi:hypothetical protein
MAILVGVLIFWPGSVTYWLDKDAGIDPAKVKIELELPDIPLGVDLLPPKN